MKSDSYLTDIVVSRKQLGDVLLLEPTLRYLFLKTGLPIVVKAKKSFDALFELMPHATLYNGKRASFRQGWVFEPGSKASIDIAFFKCKSKNLLIESKNNLKWYHRFLYNNILIAPCQKYRSEYIFDAVEEGGLVSFEKPKLESPSDSWAEGLSISESYILIHPTSAWKRKCWQAVNWAKVIDDIINEGYHVIITSGRAEWEIEHSKDIITQTECDSSKILDLSGSTSLKQLLYLVSRSKFVLSVDGAVSHMRSAFDIPGIVIFGPTSKTQWFYKDKYSHAFFTENKADMAQCSYLRYEMVIETFKKLIESKK